MDGIALFVRGQTFDQVEDAIRPFGLIGDNVVCGDRMFYFRRYPEWAAETEPGEIESLVSRLDGEVSSAFMIFVRHEEPARFALEVMANLMPKLDRALIDDDCGGLWDTASVRACHAASIEYGVYSLREWAENARNTTGRNASPRIG